MSTLALDTPLAGRYRVDRLLGRGGMALVYLAHDEALDRPVAVKLLSDTLAADEEYRARFLREARVAARLAHRNIVRIYDAGEQDGRPYIVMECVPGGTLDQVLLTRGRLPPAEAVAVAIQVCDGLDCAHAAGLVHRDVKPQNLLVAADGTVKIADFGIARPLEAPRLTATGIVLGTAAYLAPEQSEGEPVTAAADLYALGAVLYELLTGRPPHTAGSLVELLVKRLDEPVAPVRERAPDVPQALDDLVLRCLARDPAGRPASAAALARELAATLPGPSPVPVPEAAGTRATEVAAPTLRLPAARAARRPRRARRGAALAATAAVLAAGAAAAVTLAVSGGGEHSPSATAPVTPPVPRASDPAQQARELAAWLRANSR